MTRVVVIGGGVGGLAAALGLLDTFRARGGEAGHDQALSLTLLEARDQVGGRVSTEQHDGHLVELGATTLQESAPGLLDLIRRLRLQDALVYSGDAAKHRFLYRNGALRRLPERPPELLTTTALSLSARLRMLAEPFVRTSSPAPSSPADPSIAAFFRERLGTQATDELIDAALSGIFAGDIDQLSMRSALPRVFAMQAQHGSLFAALRAMPRTRARLLGFRQGLHSLPLAMAQAVGEMGGIVRCSSTVRQIERLPQHFVVTLAEHQPPLLADQLILAVPPPKAHALLRDLDPSLAQLLGGIPMAPIVAVTLGFPRDQVHFSTNGFGFLIPRKERLRTGLRMLGTLFMSSVLPDCPMAPKAQVQLRCMYGGALDPEVAHLTDGEIIEQARRDLRSILGVLAEPRFLHIQRWPQAIEQYLIGHSARLAQITARLAYHPGLHLAGAALHGVSVPDVLRHGQSLGAGIAAKLPRL